MTKIEVYSSKKKKNKIKDQAFISSVEKTILHLNEM